MHDECYRMRRPRSSEYAITPIKATPATSTPHNHIRPFIGDSADPIAEEAVTAAVSAGGGGAGSCTLAVSVGKASPACRAGIS